MILDLNKEKKEHLNIYIVTKTVDSSGKFKLIRKKLSVTTINFNYNAEGLYEDICTQHYDGCKLEPT